MIRRRLAAVLAATGLAVSGAVALAAPATADGVPPSVNGPASAPYWADVNVSGGADGPTVQLFVKRAGDSGFAAGQSTTTDIDGDYNFTLRIVRDSTYYVQDASGQQSRTITTQQYAATCGIGGAYLSTLPLGRGAAPNFASFTASTGRTFAGTTARGNTLGVIVRRPGHPASVIQTFDYSRVEHSAAAGGSLDVAGITPQGAVVASVQYTNTNLGSHLYTAVEWRNGKAYRLQTKSNWVSTIVTGVSPEGFIVGFARIPVPNSRPVYRVAIWNSVGAEVFERATGIVSPHPVLDGNDDLGFTNADGYAQALRMAGDEHELRAYPLDVPETSSHNIILTAADQDSLYGTVAPGVMHWTVPTDGGSAPVVGVTVGERAPVFAADAAGDLVVGNGAASLAPGQVHTAAGGVAPLPSQYLAARSGRRDAGVVVASSGAVAFTSSRDGLPHLLHCTTGR